MTLPPGSVWTPDTFIRNERRSEVVVAPARAEYTRVWGDGTVLHSVMYTLASSHHFSIKSQLHCPMNLRLYPFDSQTCKLHLASCE